MKIKGDWVGFNKYKPQNLYIHQAFCHLADGLIGLLSLGYYQGYYSSDAASKILIRAYEMRKKERKDSENKS